MSQSARPLFGKCKENDKLSQVVICNIKCYRDLHIVMHETIKNKINEQYDSMHYAVHSMRWHLKINAVVTL